MGQAAASKQRDTGKVMENSAFLVGHGKIGDQKQTSGKAWAVKGLQFYRKEGTETVLSGAMEGFQ